MPRAVQFPQTQPDRLHRGSNERKNNAVKKLQRISGSLFKVLHLPINGTAHGKNTHTYRQFIVLYTNETPYLRSVTIFLPQSNGSYLHTFQHTIEHQPNKSTLRTICEYEVSRMQHAHGACATPTLHRRPQTCFSRWACPTCAPLRDAAAPNNRFHRAR